MELWFQVFLFLHIGGAILAFGASLAFPIIGGMAGTEAAHRNFALRVIDRISGSRVEPLAIFVGLTGLGLIWASGRNPFAELWLLASIVAYLAALGVALFLARPNGKELVEATSGAPPPGPPPEGPHAGPPPHVAALVRRSQLFGMFLGTMVVLILFLMVFKPSLPG